LDISSYHKRKPDDGMKMERPNFGGGGSSSCIIYSLKSTTCDYYSSCNYEIHPTGMLQIVFLVSLESSRRGGVHGLGSMMFGLVVKKFFNIELILD
jgi:hypothetical protein